MRNRARSCFVLALAGVAALSGFSLAAPKGPSALAPLVPVAPIEPLPPVPAFDPIGPPAALPPLPAIEGFETIAMPRIDLATPATPKPRVFSFAQRTAVRPPQPAAATLPAPPPAPRAAAALPATSGRIAVPAAQVRFEIRSGTVGAFEIDRTEVTTRQYAACVASARCSPALSEGNCNYGKEGRGDHPINCVSATQAAAYCGSVGARLPTELEWEYAARGARPVKPLVEFQSSKDACVERTNPGTCPVAQHPSSTSPFGAEDMLGNVWEWTSDTVRLIDDDDHIVKGGGWSGPRVPLSTRASRSPQTRTDDLGFRCAKDSTAPVSRTR